MRQKKEPGWRGWATYSVITGLLTIVFIAIFGAANGQHGEIAGPFERLSTSCGTLWSILFFVSLWAWGGFKSKFYLAQIPGILAEGEHLMETQTALVLAAQAGDRSAFDTLVEPYQRELLVHCYRMLGSLHDAEDLVQETLVRAWEKRATFTSPGSYRAWLYRIATNLCLNALTRAPRRSLPPSRRQATDPTLPLPQRQREPVWLEPFPDDLLADQQTDPEYHALQREQTTLAFLVALQQLTPTQRAVLLLREVLDWQASEVAEWLNLSVPAVNSSLQRARRALHELHTLPDVSVALPTQLQPLLDRYVALWEQADIPGLIALLRDDAWFTMPPMPAWFQGRAAITTLFQTYIFTTPGLWRLYPTRANASPAFGLYRRQAETGTYQLFGLLVLSIVDEQIANTVVFLDLACLTSFALPPALTP